MSVRQPQPSTALAGSTAMTAINDVHAAAEGVDVSNMSTFVLVHGMFHDGSMWDRVIERLEELGHTVFGPTIAGHGKAATKHVDHAQSTQSIVDFIVERDLTDIVLVGHSYGGTIISKVAEAIPDRIRRLVFWSAFVLNDGESMADAGSPALRELATRLAAESPDNTFMVPFEIWRETFINDADLELARRSYEQLTPAPYGQLVEQLDLKKFYTLQIPRSYLAGTEDSAVPTFEIASVMRKRLGVHRLVYMPGSHELLFTNPVRLADKILEAGRD
ncbi:alpha/beta fold hydrolase [Mycobacterium sp. AZCC_0083]|uniref:alpha/beta fold hydrolase n=1 Tax=Mycobacterium sp. AZCC_0083 TaxID=2735882 RepID=UPI001858C56D|nr:alpha/beta fold hydrolase [Mycobacterium sp. AZCC_0083]MBB5167542.1 pimeloyl-ACP methyl ester carboxylesterase [Mycobacterium sp. AZCC_0083]